MTTTIPSAGSVFAKLLRADMTTLWRNRRASLLVVLVPTVILISWKGLVPRLGGAFVLANCITVGLTAIGLMGYTNTLARDRDKGIFQRLRVAPAPKWTIMTSRLTVQLLMILITTLVLFMVGYKFDGIVMTPMGYLGGALISIVCGAVYLSLGQVIVGLIKNVETVNVVTRLVYFIFIMVGMFGELGMLGDQLKSAVHWSPYGTVKNIVSASVDPATWNKDSTTALLVTLGYTAVFTVLGVRWFRWNTR
jgi:ABC-2 type transport system permease protein